MGAADASLIALHVMTSSGMPKEVYLEDVIERVVKMVKVQLQHTIYPEFDPVYRVDPKNKSKLHSTPKLLHSCHIKELKNELLLFIVVAGYTGNTKAKRARSHGTKNSATLYLYNKLSQIVGLLSELVDMQTLTDNIVLEVSTKYA